MRDFARDENVDLTFVGPEAPLALGIEDVFRQSGLILIGPSKEAAQLESSKAWAKALMVECQIPTASYQEFEGYDSAKTYIQTQTYPLVIKADGLAAGKGVTVAQTIEDADQALRACFIDDVFNEAGNKVIIESFLEGEEASIFAFTDGDTVRPMVPAQDHKQIFDGDKGPNTGGMGAYSPAPVVTNALYQQTIDQVFLPLIDGFKRRGIEYKGILYAGLMVYQGQVSVVEFNARFGDPETQVVLPRLQTDLLEILIAISQKRLADIQLQWVEKSVACVVMAAGGYPAQYEKGNVISGIDQADALEGTHVIQAGTKVEDDHIVTNGGRVLGVVSEGNDISSAVKQAYNGIELISFDGHYYRKDIAFKAHRHASV